MGPVAIETTGAVQAVIKAAIPDIDCHPDGSGTDDGFSVAFSPDGGDGEPINGVALMFGGAGDAAYVAVAIAEELSARALGSGEFLDLASTENAMSTWQRSPPTGGWSEGE